MQVPLPVTPKSAVKRRVFGIRYVGGTAPHHGALKAFFHVQTDEAAVLARHPHSTVEHRLRPLFVCARTYARAHTITFAGGDQQPGGAADGHLGQAPGRGGQPGGKFRIRDPIHAVLDPGSGSNPYGPGSWAPPLLCCVSRRPAWRWVGGWAGVQGLGESVPGPGPNLPAAERRFRRRAPMCCRRLAALQLPAKANATLHALAAIMCEACGGSSARPHARVLCAHAHGCRTALLSRLACLLPLAPTHIITRNTDRLRFCCDAPSRNPPCRAAPRRAAPVCCCPRSESAARARWRRFGTPCASCRAACGTWAASSRPPRAPSWPCSRRRCAHAHTPAGGFTCHLTHVAFIISCECM